MANIVNERILQFKLEKEAAEKTHLLEQVVELENLVADSQSREYYEDRISELQDKIEELETALEECRNGGKN